MLAKKLRVFNYMILKIEENMKNTKLIKVEFAERMGKLVFSCYFIT